jgi:hypothetical protein
MTVLTLANDTLKLDFDRETGALVGLAAPQTGWTLLDRPHLGLSWRLLVPTRTDPDWHAAGKRNNPVYGEKQRLSRLDVAEDGRRATFVWNDVCSEYGGVLPINVVLDVQLTDRQAVFGVTVENNSEYTVENVYAPCLGDVQPPPGAEWFKTFVYNYASAQEWSLWPTFQNMRGYFGVDYPTQFSTWGASSGAPMSPYILLRGERQGLYVGVAEPSPELVAWHAELRPGYGSSIDARVPVQRTIAGLDVATRFAAVHVPYIQPGETRKLTPVALEPFQGDWQAGVDIYKTWRSTWYKPAIPPAWAREPHAWQQLHINSPEDELRIPFGELPKVAETCAKHGVRAIQLVGWNDGGQDQGNPSHDPDPRLGTFQELRDAISDCRALGVKIILFSKFTWADRATPRFRNDLVRLAIKDPYGDYQMHNGYEYQTATQLLDINTKRLVPMCFLSEEYLAVCQEEFRKTVELGAAGILFDECLHHSPALLCFDREHGHRYAAPVYANDRELIRRFMPLAPDDFLYAGEACYDWEMETYMVSYHRSENKHHIPLSRYMLPEGLFMTAVTGFDDRNMVNQCLLYRYIISYEPYNFKGSLDDYPATTAYGSQMDALRAELREYFWDGEYRGTIGATVTVDGVPHHPYSVFASRSTGKLGLVVANYDERNAITAQVEAATGMHYRLVADTEWRPVDGGVTLPPMSAAVVIA